MDRERADRLKALLGSWRDSRGPISAVVTGSTVANGVVIEDLSLKSDDDTLIPALLCRPQSTGSRQPAVLYAHAHGHNYGIGRRELVDGRPAVAEPAYGPLLAARGYVALCLDMATFGERAGVGESALAKARHWQGATLFGDMLSDLARGLDCLAGRSDVDPARIGVLGLSMGATQAYWLAALDERVAAVAHLCAFASLRRLVESGAHDLHGTYMTVPGLLAEWDTGEIAGLVAPRPQLIGVGLGDPLTPRAAFEEAWRDVRAAYRRAGAEDRLTACVEPESGHRESRSMGDKVLEFLDRHLKP